MCQSYKAVNPPLRSRKADHLSLAIGEVGNMKCTRILYKVLKSH